MTKPVFLYAMGTSFWTTVFNLPLFPLVDPNSPGQVNSWGGKSFYSGPVDDDPFWRVLDPQVWDSRKIKYPAATWPMNLSIDSGVAMTVAQIQALPSGTPFCLGGASQGAAVMSKVYRQITDPAGALYSRRASFKGGVMFGNPMRQENFLAPDLTYSGSWDMPGSNTGGSGCFPDRLSNCELGLWREYVNADEIITATGTSFQGNGWRGAVGFLAGLSDPLTALLAILPGSGFLVGIASALGIGAGGHIRYPLFPPTGLTGLSSYERAFSFLGTVATEVNASPILPITHPSMNYPWTTCRTFPAA
jgi:hypothetical protein